jgi:hypothetical protein
VQDALKSQQKSTQTNAPLPSDEWNRSSAGGLVKTANDAYERRAAAEADGKDAGTSKDSATAKSDDPDQYLLPPFFHPSGDGFNSFRSPLLPGGDARDTPDTSLSHTANGSEPDKSGLLGPGGTGGPGHDVAGNGADAASAKSPTTTGIPQGGPKTAQAAPPASPQRNPGLMKYDYQTLYQRGSSLSGPRTSYAGPASSTGMGTSDSYENNPEGPGGPLSHEFKDPISKTIGPGSEYRAMYGPLGSSASSSAPQGPLGSASAIDSDGKPRGFGSYIPSSSLPQFQHYDLHLPKPTHTAPNSDPSARTYDPVRGY